VPDPGSGNGGRSTTNLVRPTVGVIIASALCARHLQSGPSKERQGRHQEALEGMQECLRCCPNDGMALDSHSDPCS